MKTYYTIIDTPLGNMTIQANDQGLLGAWFETQTTQPDSLGQLAEHQPILLQASQQLQEYFSGTR